ncbi:MAG: Adaptive-response sensory-kinase SasA [Anaerolineae bacterium]|nr:Adaptive-response sensory-kinase SasA [Anaerolineae bacterium]
MTLRLSITAKLTLLFVLFAALLLLAVGALAYASGRAALEAATISDLLSTAIEKEAALNAWVQDRQAGVISMVHSPHLVADVAALAAAAPGSTEAQRAHDDLTRELQTWAGPGKEYLTLLVIEAGTGRVIAATDPNEEGKFKENRPYFINGESGPYIQNIYYSLVVQGPAMTVAAPIRAADGRLLGVLAGRLNLEELDTIINRRTDLHETDDAFLVNTSNLIVTQPRFISDPAVLRRGIHTEAVKQCLAPGSGVISSGDYRDVAAFTVYRWLPERELCLIVKIDRAEALAPTHAFGQTILLIGSLALVAASILALGLARTITRPVLALRAGAIRLGQGQLNARLPETSGDELGQLAREFNVMAAALAEKETQLRRYTEALEQMVEERTASLRQSEGQFRLVVEASPNAIILVSTTGQINLVNAQTENLFGYSRNELLGQPVELLIPTQFHARHNRYRDAFLAAPTARPMGAGRDLYGLRKDGRQVPVEIGLAPITTPAGQFVLASIIDITGRKQAEEEVARSFQREQRARIEAEAAQQRMAFLVEAGNTLASSLDYHTTLAAVAQLAVPRIADWCAVDVVEPDGSLQRVAVVHTDPAKVELAYELQRRNPPNPDALRGIYQVLRSGKAELYPEISAAVLKAAGLEQEQLDIIHELGLNSAITAPMVIRGRALGVITFVAAESRRCYSEADLATAQELAGRAALAVDNARLYRQAQRLNVELEDRVKERTAQLEATNKELEAFAYSVSHDLRAPLRSIDGFSQALQEDYADSMDSEAHRYLQRVRAASQRMAQLIDDLLMLSRLTRSEMRPERVNLSALARSIAAELCAAEPDRQVEFVIAPDVVVTADAHLMRVALENLLGNAFKFTAKQAAARIEFGVLPQPKDHAVYFVRDDGAGFDMAYIDKLFGAFQRLHTPAEFSGTGIGLATVQRIIHRHGGRVWAEGAVNQGATFYFTLDFFESRE